MTFLIRILLTLVMAPALAQAPPISVGAVVSQTGALASLAEDYRRGLILWQEELNASGGLLGRPVELRLRDDGSDARRSAELYAELIREKTDLLIGPYGSAATLTAAAEVERAQRVLMNGAGASPAVHKRSPRWLFQTTTPNSAYGEGVLDLAKGAGVRALYLLARNEYVTSERADATRERAEREGLKLRSEVYPPGTDDFSPYIAHARGEAEAWIAFGEMRDAADMIRQFRKLDYAPRMFFVSSAADRRVVDLVGQDAEYLLGIQEYDPAWNTPGNDRFAAAYRKKWGRAPTFAAAQGYSAGTVLAEAVRRAGTLDQAKLRATLAQMEADTVLGGYKVDPATGEQRAAKPAVIQIQRGRPRVVWPEWLQSAPLQPYPEWHERRYVE